MRKESRDCWSGLLPSQVRRGFMGLRAFGWLVHIFLV